MFRKWLALIGVLLILTSIIIGLAWAKHRPWMGGFLPESEPSGLWQFLRSMTGVAPEQALPLSLVGLLLGLVLTMPWWRRRLQQEELWWQKRDEPVKGPPHAGV